VDYHELVERTTEAMPTGQEHRADFMVEATLSALIPWLPEHALHALLEALPGAPAELRRGPKRKHHAKEPAPAQIQAQVAKRVGVPSSRAIEIAQIVCGTMGRTLDPELCAELVRSLPTELGPWFDAVPRFEAPATGLGRGHHLSDGKPGAAHTMSEGAPGSSHPVDTAHPGRRQSNSVAADNPHGDSKVSSARGLTQEREHESLAEGRDPR
jgi:hypothetical protein